MKSDNLIYELDLGEILPAGGAASARAGDDADRLCRSAGRDRLTLKVHLY